MIREVSQAGRLPVRLTSAEPLRRLGWQTADQLASSASNYLFVVVAARLLGPAGFGVVSLVLATWALGLTGVRALVGQPLVGYAGGRSVEIRETIGVALGWLTAATATVSAGGFLVGLVLDPAPGR
ncbi:MAG: hypothetical protein KatS3mg014_2036 [Actinomycetota bacterium]|nr:MAG: hypothetical protein KatS3mg014_2036 [Actinomycetota bacterium]